MSIFKGLSKGYLALAVLHFGTFVLALTICGLYGVDLSRASKAGVPPDSRWAFAEVVGGMAALVSILYAIPFIQRLLLPWASIVLLILSMALFGVFGHMYIREDPEGNGDIQRMKNAVWVDLAHALLWLISTLAGFAYWFHHRETRTLFTGRAHV